MIRHGPPCKTVARHASWPERALTYAPKSGPRLLSQSAETGFGGYLFLLETIALVATTIMPGNLRQPPEPIQNLFYP